MYTLVICLVFIILRAEANIPESENPDVRLSYNYDGNENYVVLKDKPLRIIIENGFARYVWCSNKYAKIVGDSTEVETFIPETEFLAGNYSILNIKNVTVEMSTTWVCRVLQEHHGSEIPFIHRNRKYTPKNLYFNLHVKGARAVILNANIQNLKYVTTNLTVNYDGEFKYTYEDGEDIPFEFWCRTPDDYLDTVRLEYYNAEGILLFQNKPRVKLAHTFRSVLKSYNDKYYLDCIRASRNPEREYRYRITFIKRDLHADAVQHAVILYVNGLKLSKLLNESNYHYIFYYLYGEVLNVTCRKSDVNLIGSLTFEYDKDKHNIKTLRRPSDAVISLNIITSDMHHEYLICSITTDVEKPKARLSLWPDVPVNDVRIGGLSRNNILYQYTNDLDQWTIEYQYNENDTLNLTCVWNGNLLTSGLSNGSSVYYGTPFRWEFEGRSFDSAAIEVSSTPLPFSEIPFTKILNATHNGNKIKCICYPNELHSYLNKAVEIILRLKPKLVSEENEIVSSLVYYLTAAGVTVSIILILIYWSVKNSSCGVRSSPRELPPVPEPTSHPVTNYYENLLAVFQPINEREAMEMENHYEVVQ